MSAYSPPPLGLSGRIARFFLTSQLTLLIALVLYAVIGMQYAGGELEARQIATMLETMEARFFIHPLLLLPPPLVIAMVVKRVPPLPALLGGTLIGAVCAVAIKLDSRGPVLFRQRRVGLDLVGVRILEIAASASSR